ncbi:hypothetical protein ACQ4LE_009876 [Meloidogyne hapla]
MEEMAQRNVTNFFPALYGMNPRELRRRVASKLVDKICVVSNKTVVESGDSGGPLLISTAQGKWSQIGTLTGGPCHGKDSPLHVGEVAFFFFSCASRTISINLPSLAKHFSNSIKNGI